MEKSSNASAGCRISQYLRASRAEVNGIASQWRRRRIASANAKALVWSSSTTATKRPTMDSYGTVGHGTAASRPTSGTMCRYHACTSSVLLSRACEDNDDTPRIRPYEISAARFGRYVRGQRRDRGLTQEQLAERCELSSDAIRRIEGGRLSPTLTTLGKLAHGLDINLSTLFVGVERARRPVASEVADYLSRRTPKECELAWRVVRSLFVEPS